MGLFLSPCHALFKMPKICSDHWYLNVSCFRAHLEEYIEHLPLGTDRKAMKVLRLCEDLDMLPQGNAIKRYNLF